MSNFINRPHSATLLLKSVAIAVALGAQTLEVPLTTNKMLESITLRVKADFKHGENKADTPKYGGIYNLIKSAKVQVNGDLDSYTVSGVDLYNDNFVREGRENNDMDYADLPNSHTQNINYCFKGRKTVLAGGVVPDGYFALDLRHTEAKGNQTYHTVNLILDIGAIQDVFQNANDTSLSGLTIEIFGNEIFHDAQSRAVLLVEGARYAEISYKAYDEKIVDTSLVQKIPLEAVGKASSGVYLSDLVITQTDENGAPIPFTDEDASLSIEIAGNADNFDFCKMPVWAIREMQNKRRLQGVPPNVLIIPIVQAATGLGGLSPAELFAGATLCVKANTIEGQSGDTRLRVQKAYTAKAV